MKEIKIMLNEITTLKQFVNVSTSMKYDNVEINVHSENRKYTVDGKSIIGIFSLDLSKPIYVSLLSKNDTECTDFLNEIAKFVTIL